jgi:predicted acetyltransferase
MELIAPSEAFLESYQAALAEFDTNGVSGFWKSFGPIDDVAQYLMKIRQYQHVAGVENFIAPANVFWLVDGRDFIGHVSVRHTLNAALRRKGGHIGYAIRPSKQWRGYGTCLLGLVLPHAKALGIEQALLTCDKGNIASRKIIEKHGGIMIDATEFNEDGVIRFWIPL